MRSNNSEKWRLSAKEKAESLCVAPGVSSKELISESNRVGFCESMLEQSNEEWLCPNPKVGGLSACPCNKSRTVDL